MNKTYASIYADHFGKITSNLSIFGVSLMAIILLGSIISILFYVFSLFLAFIIIITTMGTIFISYPNFIHDMVNVNGALPKISMACLNAFPYIFGVTLAMSIISLVFLCIDKDRRSVPRIVFSCIILGLVVVFGVLFLLGGFK